jgi:hypothetical protein
LSLALACYCTTDVSICSLQSLTLHLEVLQTFAGTPSIGALHTLTIYANPSDGGAATIQLIDPSPGNYTYDLPLADWAATWDQITVELVTFATLTQVPSPAYSAYDLFQTSYYINQHYACVNADSSVTTDWDVRSYASNPEDPTRCEPTAGDLRTLCYAGGVAAIFYKSTPLASCGGCTITDGSFLPKVDTVPKVDLESSGAVCLCATGGSGSYTYSVSVGNLPCGMTLNPSTGCIEGSSDGTCPASSEIVFQVMDSGGGSGPGVAATVTCSVIGGGCSTAGLTAGNDAY